MPCPRKRNIGIIAIDSPRSHPFIVSARIHIASVKLNAYGTYARAPMHMPPTYQWMRNRIRPRRVCRQSRLSWCGHSVMALTRHLAYGGAVDQAQARHPLPSVSPISSSCERVAAGSIRLSSQHQMLHSDSSHMKSKIRMDPRGEEWASIPDSDRHTSTPLHIWREQT